MDKLVEIKPSPKTIVILHGMEYPLKRPSAAVVADFEERMEAAKESKKASTVVAVIVDFLTAMGLPKVIADELDLDELNQVIEAITLSKKN